MSDHTPTTEDEIRRVMTPLIGWPRLDRWLAEVKAQAWQEGVVASGINLDWQLHLSDHNHYKEEA